MTYREIYERALNDLEHNKITLGEFDERVKPLNQEPTSVIAELEKIKQEIGKEFVDLQDGSEEWRSYVNDAVLSCYEIVDKHIIDLKGEIANSKGVLEQIAEDQKTLLDTTKAWSNYIDKNGNIY